MKSPVKSSNRQPTPREPFKVIRGRWQRALSGSGRPFQTCAFPGCVCGSKMVESAPLVGAVVVCRHRRRSPSTTFLWWLRWPPTNWRRCKRTTHEIKRTWRSKLCQPTGICPRGPPEVSLSQNSSLRSHHKPSAIVVHGQSSEIEMRNEGRDYSA